MDERVVTSICRLLLLEPRRQPHRRP